MNTADPAEMVAWDNYLGQLASARFDRDRPPVASQYWATVADAMLVERRKRNLPTLKQAAWDVFYGSIIAGYGGIMPDVVNHVALACDTAARAADDLLVEHTLRWKGLPNA